MIISQGAEAIIRKEDSLIIKERIVKGYRESSIDFDLRRRRTKKEAKIIEDLQDIVNVPSLIECDIDKSLIKMSFIEGIKLAEGFEKVDVELVCKKIGKSIALMHNKDIIHGDLTTSNMIFNNDKVFFIDFGLSMNSSKAEDKAVDLHLLRCALESKHYTIFERAFEIVMTEYERNSKDAHEVLRRFELVEKRGRNKLKH